MRKVINRANIIGRINDHKLVQKTVQKQGDNFGKPFIMGSLDIVTDDDGLNVVTVYYRYVTEYYSSGKKNNTYDILKNIAEGKVKTVMSDGFENAAIVKCDTSIAINDFYVHEGSEDRLVSAKRLEGGFVSNISKDKMPAPEKRNAFECDMLILGATVIEADEEKGIEEDYLKIKGNTFAFNNAAIPVEFIIKDKNGMKYFESLDASPSNPVFTKVWGNIKSQTIVDRREEESAFGGPSIKEYEKVIKEWLIIGASPNNYEIGDAENGITPEEWTKIKADRETHLAEVKKNQEEYEASKNSLPFGDSKSTTSAPAAAGGFNF